MTFLRNAWYVAAWEDEVAPGASFHRRLLNEDILLVRDASGMAHALRNRCPHRFAPLHLGKLHGDRIECGYHGLQFSFEGRCVHNPHGKGEIPNRAAVPTYPLVVKQMLLWIWMGEPSLADPAAIPDFEGLDPQHWAINKGYLLTPANYEYMTDNIMDLGHIEYLHQGLLGSETVRRAATEMSQSGTTVYSKRLTHNEILPPPLDLVFETNRQPVDRWLDVRWDPPGLMQLVVGVAPTGSPPRVGRATPGVHLMTPETQTTTHYFWSNSRDFRRDDAKLHQMLEEGLRYAFEQQDKPMIAAQCEAIEDGEFWSMKPIILEGDAGAVRARRILRRLIHEEGQRSAMAMHPGLPPLASSPQTPPES